MARARRANPGRLRQPHQFHRNRIPRSESSCRDRQPGRREPRGDLQQPGLHRCGQLHAVGNIARPDQRHQQLLHGGLGRPHAHHRQSRLRHRPDRNYLRYLPDLRKRAHSRRNRRHQPDTQRGHPNPQHHNHGRRHLQRHLPTRLQPGRNLPNFRHSRRRRFGEYNHFHFPRGRPATHHHFVRDHCSHGHVRFSNPDPAETPATPR